MIFSNLYDSHIHTRLCQHASGEPLDYAAIAAERGLRGIVITDHNPSLKGWEPHLRMAMDELDLYLEMIERARKKWAPKLDVRRGMECDYIPGFESDIESLLARAEFDFILGSVHCNMRGYQELFFRGDVQEFTQLYYDHLAQAAELGCFDALSHPDIPKILWPDKWDLDQVWSGLSSSLDRIAQTGIDMELNTSGVYKAYGEMHPSATILHEMRKRDIGVVLGSDAHSPDRVGDLFTEAIQLLMEVGYESIGVYRNRERHEIPIAQLIHED